MKVDEVTDEELTALLSTDQAAFTQQCFHTVSPAHKYIHNWHIDCIVEHLQALERGEIRRLIMNMPPRCLKSIAGTIAWPAWLLGHHPSTQIITTSYSHDLSIKHSRETRLVMGSPWYKECFPLTKISNTQDEKRNFHTTKKGFRRATSVFGSVLGDGGDVLIIDDPIKANEAYSETIRESTNNWIDQGFLPRENEPGKTRVLLSMQRLHENDTTGHLKEKGGWHELILPAYFEKKTIIDLGKNRWICNEGEFLHEKRLGEDTLDEKLKDLGLYGFAGQYLQRPTPPGGGEFKARYVQYYNNYAKDFTANGMNVYILYDPANTKKKASNHDPDYTAMIVVGLASDNNYYILDLVRDRLNPTERVDKLFDLHMKWAKLSGEPPAVGIEHYGMMTEEFYIKKEMNRRNYRFRSVAVKGALKKEDRIRRLIPLFENYRVYFPKDITYVDVDGVSKDLVDVFIQQEMMVFPIGKHDDMIDAFSRIADNDLQASFPEIGTVYLQAGQSLKDLYAEGFDENNYMSW